MTTISKVRYSRRSLLKSGGAAVAAAALPAPMVWGQETKNITWPNCYHRYPIISGSWRRTYIPDAGRLDTLVPKFV